jgi:hypothetical protein
MVGSKRSGFEPVSGFRCFSGLIDSGAPHRRWPPLCMRELMEAHLNGFDRAPGTGQPHEHLTDQATDQLGADGVP